MVWLGGRWRSENSHLAQLELTGAQLLRACVGAGQTLELRTSEAPAQSGVSVQQILARALRRLRLAAGEDWSGEGHRVVRADYDAKSLVCGV